MKNCFRRLLTVLAVTVCSSAAAQTAAPGPKAAPPAASTAVHSPEVHGDRSVTFRLRAPKASEVTLKGDWFDEPKPFVRSENGVWRITVGPMAPAKYIYNFTVDGITIADPANAQVKLRQQGQGSFFEVRGETPGVADIRDVPHGTIETVTRKSSVLGDTRSFLVYTPPGYEQERERRYPVLYLLHGHNDRPVGWVDVGHIHFIADNLIAEKKAVPMIIVLPPTHAVPIDSPAEVQRTNGAVFEEYLLKDVIPAVEAQYRIAAGRHQRAIAGFSMGGGIALRVFANHVDKFCAVGLFSTAQSRALQERADIFADAKAFNARVDAFYIGAGRQEPRFLTTSSELHTSLTKLGIHHTWRPADGYHHFALWRRHAIEFLPLLFNAAGPAATAARQDGKRGPKVK